MEISERTLGGCRFKGRRPARTIARGVEHEEIVGELVIPFAFANVQAQLHYRRRLALIFGTHGVLDALHTSCGPSDKLSGVLQEEMGS